jgi:hypothetical protein
MHLLDHARPGVTGVWVLASHWVMTRGHAMLWDALMGSERLRHHHCGRSRRGRGTSTAKYRDGDEEATGKGRFPGVARLKTTGRFLSVSERRPRRLRIQ